MLQPGPRACVYFVANGLILALVARLMLALGLEFLCFDDFPRLAISIGFAENPSLTPAGSFWLPLHFWLYGGWYALAGRAMNSYAWCWPLSVALLALAITFLQLAAERLATTADADAGTVAGDDQRSPRRAWPLPVLVFVLALSMPMFWRLTVSGMSEVTATALFAGVIWALTCDNGPRARLLAGLALLAGTQMVRYEAWPFAFAVWAVLLVSGGAEQRFSQCWWAWLAGGWAVLLVFPLGWMAVNWRLEGDALNFLRHGATQVNIDPALEQADPLRRGWFLLKTFAAQGWIIAAGALAGGWMLPRRRAWPLAAISLLWMPVYLQSIFNNTIHTVAIGRVMLPVCVALLPLAAAGLVVLLERLQPSRLAMAVFLILAAMFAAQSNRTVGHRWGGPVFPAPDRAAAVRYAQLCRAQNWVMVVEARDYGHSIINPLRIYAGPHNVLLPDWLGPDHAGRPVVFVTDQPRPSENPSAWMLNNAVYELEAGAEMP